ncbi:MAG: hypothetical protein ACR2NB_10480 [Solirubrobacteraceae bacterium]
MPARPRSVGAGRGAVLSTAALACVAALAGCGGKADISRAESAFNAQLKMQKVPVTIDCPREVSPEKAFNCDVVTDKGTRRTPVRFELTGKDHDTLDVTDQKAFENVLIG